jgi:hypothetical protein
MGLASGYRVQLKSRNGWRTVRTWTVQTAANEDAYALFAEHRNIEGVLSHGAPLAIPMHPRVRVMHGSKVVLDLDITPANRKQVA